MNKNWICEILAERVAREPRFFFLFDGEETDGVSNAKVLELSGRVYAYLKANGIEREDFVLINLPRGVKPLVAELGVWRAGAAFAIVESAYAPERIAFIRKDCGCKLEIDAAAWERILLTEPLDGYEPVGEHDACFAVYTSGTTGTPKGVLHEYGNLRYIAESISYGGKSLFPTGERFALVAPLNFVASVMAFVRLVAVDDSRLYVVPYALLKTPPAFVAFMKENGILATFLSPSYVRTFGTKAFPTLKRLVVGSEPANGIAPADGLDVFNVYAMSECGFALGVFRIDRAYDACPVGRPQVDRKVVLLGKDGEICVENPFVRGYINRPEETAKAFRDGLYHTGDLARQEPSGDFTVIGRASDMVKINGNRVEPAEVEAVAKEALGVSWCAVRGFEDDAQAFLAAYYTDDIRVDADKVRAEMAKKLPYYMLPQHFVRIENAPILANGKLDRKALPRPQSGEAGDVPPETELQKRIFELVAGAVGHRRFGIDTGLVSAGLTSIAAMKLTAALGEGFGRPITFADLQRFDTVRKLEGFLTEARDEGRGMRDEGWKKRDDYPITKTQMGIFVECQGHPEATTYNIPVLVRLAPSIDVRRLAKACRAAIDAHPYVKTHLFQDESGNVRAKRRDDAEANVRIVKGRLPDQKALVRPFDLIDSDLYRIEIYRTNKANYLFADFHHIISDGTSERIFFADVDRAYAGTKPEPETYTGFEMALDEEVALKSEAFGRAKQHFDSIFEGCESDSRPPYALERPVSGVGFSRVECGVPVADVVRFCRRNGLSESAFFNAAFGWTLAKYLGREETVYTTIYNGRNDSRKAGAMSMMVKTLPVMFRTKDGDGSVTGLVRGIGRQLLAGMANDIYSFADIAHAYGIRADVQFAYQGADFSGDRLCGQRCRMISLPPDRAKAPLTIEFRIEKGRYVLLGEFDTAIYSEAFLADFSKSVAHVAGQFLSRRKACEIDLLDGFRRRRVLSAGDGGALAYDRTKTVVDLFRGQVAAHPDKTALVFGMSRYSYADLDRLTDAVALALAAKGAGREKVVGVLVPRSEWITILSLGVLKSGAAYLPLDPSYPDDRLNLMLADSGAAQLISTPELDKRIGADFAGERISLIDLSVLPPVERSGVRWIRRRAPRPGDLFCMLYTSGTTGLPKGALIEHRNVTAFTVQNVRNFRLDANSVVAAYASYGFDANIMDTYSVLAAGGTLEILPEEIRLDLDAVRRRFEESGVTHTMMTTQIGRQFAQEGGSSKLKCLMVGGEKLVPLDPPAFRLYNGYGPSESVCYVTSYVLDRKVADVPIGKANRNVRLYVCDSDGRLLPPNAVGELRVAGPQVCRGYLNRPEKTAEAFVRNTFTKDPECARVYRTGDIVQMREDGTVIFIGRRDGQVKVRGFRVELSEVEEVVRRFPGVRDATVAAFDDAGGGKFVAAYVVGDAPIDVKAMEAFIAAEKPPYMVPAVTMQIDRIPLNQNSKVNKRALPKPERKAEDLTPPGNDVQRRIFGIVSEVVGHGAFGIDTALSAAGLTSIGAVRLNVLLGKAFGRPVRIGDLQEHDTVRKLEGFLAEASEERRVKSEEFRVKQDDYPITKTQMGIFVECQGCLGSTKYNIPVLLKLGSGIDVERLAAACRAAVDAHPYVKAHLFLNENGEVRAKRRDDAEANVKVIDGPLPDPKSLVRPFELVGSDLYRIEIYRAPGTEHEARGTNYLFVDFHHIVSDGSSEGIFFADVDRAYAGQAPERETYSGFEVALDEEEARKGEAYRKARAHFDSIFAGCEPDALPPFDVVEREPGLGRRSRPCDLDVARVLSFCKGLGTSPNAFFNVALGFTLSRYANLGEVVYTTIYNGRSDSRTANAMSMFVKTLPVMFRRDGGTDVGDAVKAMGEQLMGAMANDIFSFAEISEAYGIRSDVLFAYQGDGFVSGGIGGEACEPVPLALDRAKTPILIQAEIRDGRYALTGEFDASLYFDEFIDGFLECFATVAEELLRKKTLGEIDICPADQLRRLDAFNAETVPYDATRTVIDQFRARAAEAPDALAVVHMETRLTYREADVESDRIAAHLAASGVGTGDVVAVLIPRCRYMVTASLGVLKAGAAYQPLDPTYPPERLEYMIADSGAKLLIADEALLGCVPGYKGPVATLKELDGLKDLRLETLDARPSPEDAFVLLYTSGSTGKPKGAVLEHRNLIAFCAWYRRHSGIDAQSRVAAYASYGFDASMMDIYPALTAGAAVVIIDESIRLDLMAIDRHFAEQGVTHAFMTTQIGRQYSLMATAPSLKWLSVGGEALVPVDPPKGFRLVNGYGPTECTVFTTVQEVDRGYRRVPIGRALDNLRLYVVDEKGRRLPPGVPGELWVAGPQACRGYLNDSGRTAEAFVANPFGEDEWARAYRTGDIVRFLPDGAVDFIGRRDGQVKVRGFRIELSEVEEVVRRFPGVKDATVAAFDDPGGGKFIAAYVVGDAPVSVDALNAFIAAEKPPYMVPAVTMQIDRIPLNQNQKVNKRALPKPERKAADLTPPENDVQRKVFDLVAEVLGHRAFGIDTGVYEAGLTSIGAVRLNVILGKAFGRPMKIADLRENDTVRKLEVFLTEESAECGVQSAVLREKRDDYPLTKTQMGVLVECQMHPDSTIYNVPLLLKVGAGMDAERLAAACRTAIDAHPYVKTRLFQDANGAVRAKRRDDAEANVKVIDGELPDPKSLVRPFDVFGGDLYRIEIYQTPGTNYLFLDFLHVIYDGTSQGVFLADVNRAYAGMTPERETYSGYEMALDEEVALKSGALEKAKADYDAVFCGCEPDALPPYVIEDAVPGVKVEDLPFAIDAVRVAAFCKSNGASENAFFNAAFGLTLAKYAGRTDAVFTTIYNGRGDSRTAGCVSMLVKTLPVLVDLKAGDGTVAGLVRRTKDQLLMSMSNDIFSFADVSKAYGIRADAMFSYQSGDFGELSLCGEPVESVPLELDAAKSALSVELIPDGKGYRLSVEFDTGVYSEAFVRGFGESLQAVAEAFLTEARLCDVDLTTPSQREVWDRYNATETPYDREKTLVDRIREQAAAHPDRAALVYLGNRYAYGELDRMTDRIAAELVRRGAGRDRMVGILVPRSEWIAILSLAVLKARSGYLPMDTSYPDDRLNLMLKDSGAVILVTTPELLGRVSGYMGPVVTLEELEGLEDLRRETSDANLVSQIPRPTPDDLFIMLYTSGTTGVPKGTVIDHSNMIAFSEEHRRITRITERTVWASFASFGFDTCLSDIFPTLAYGGELHILPEDRRLDLLWVQNYFNENGVTHTDMTTQVGRQFALLKGTRTLELLNVGGEKLVPLDPPPFRMINAYGPSECTCYISTYELDRRHKEVPIGRPLGNAKFYVCDPEGRLLPPNAVGELWIAGPQVARGYLNRPEKTAEAFIANPFGEGRVYRTGDIVSLRDDGQLMFVGRRDGQVKVRGFRIELTEVEEVIRRFPGVKDATVQAFDDPNGNGKFVAAYVVADGQVDVRGLNAFIRSEKPPYMVPAVTMQIEKIPLNQNSKVDRRALPKPEVQRTEAYVEPATDTERFFCKAFAELLELERVGATDDFFEIGGSSIVAISLLAAAGKAGHAITYTDIFERRTPRALASFCDGGTKEERTRTLFDFDAYDHDKLAATLEGNALEGLRKGERLPIGNVLLTGATGFMGMHVLMRLLESERGRICCLVRRSRQLTAEERLRTMLHYYFGDRLESEFDARVTVVDGDVTKPESLEPLLGERIDTVFNCAANVKHFSGGTDIEDVNIGGVKTVIGFCLKSGARLVHFSTVSVGGIVGLRNGAPEFVLDERTLYRGQGLENRYTGSKMISELEVFKAVAEEGLSAKVIRVGSLSPREADGEFQINFRTNSFMGRLRACAVLGCCPYSILDETDRLDPIDAGAAAYVALAKTPECCRLFHATNSDSIPMGNLIRMMNAAGVKVDFVEEDAFAAALDKAMKDPLNAQVLQPLLAYGQAGEDVRVPTPVVNRYTTHVLARMGFFWSSTSDEYVKAFVEVLKGLWLFKR